jgi:hypothetical protein
MDLTEPITEGGTGALQDSDPGRDARGPASYGAGVGVTVGVLVGIGAGVETVPASLLD